MRPSLTTRAATGTVPSVSLQPATAGSLKRTSSLLPVPYAHVVFTVPEQLAPLALRNQKLFYTLLFRAASETLLEIAADPRHLGARIGVLAVLAHLVAESETSPAPALFGSSRWTGP